MNLKLVRFVNDTGFQHNCGRGTANKASKRSKKRQKVKLSVALGCFA